MVDCTVDSAIDYNIFVVSCTDYDFSSMIRVSKLGMPRHHNWLPCHFSYHYVKSHIKYHIINGLDEKKSHMALLAYMVLTWCPRVA